VPIRTLRIDINPLRDFRYVATATRYATLDMFASQTRDLYHIETDRKGGYIEFAAFANIFRKSANISSRAKRGISTNSICGHRCSACQEN
jgi:hypothetical protein